MNFFKSLKKDIELYLDVQYDDSIIFDKQEWKYYHFEIIYDNIYNWFNNTEIKLLPSSMEILKQLGIIKKRYKND